ncbi:hypothetical protein RJ640_000648 [Escallonia rubra]|uniref:Tify domain-containing protein n=1 Tax=Escallonia rubra TaxID=112253 RepID=A0AA88QSL3_9ASTE|nr:hypothetical protein RJ640_000648 [Escallonia rubra]
MAERSKNWKGYDIDLSCSNSEDADDDPDYIVRFSSRLSKENNSASFNEPIKEGTLRRDGILCFCCYEVYTAENFQVHAGGKPHKSYEYIFVVDKRVSLVSCMIEAWNRPEESERCRVNEIETKGSAGDPYDDACMICADGGNLMCCDNKACSSTYHHKCMDMKFLKVPGTAPIAFASSVCVLAGERTIYLHVLSVRRIVKEKLGKIVGEENQLDDGSTSSHEIPACSIDLFPDTTTSLPAHASGNAIDPLVPGPFPPHRCLTLLHQLLLRPLRVLYLMACTIRPNPRYSSLPSLMQTGDMILSIIASLQISISF